MLMAILAAGVLTLAQFQPGGLPGISTAGPASVRKAADG
jgi:hypothetical protein